MVSAVPHPILRLEAYAFKILGVVVKNSLKNFAKFLALVIILLVVYFATSAMVLTDMAAATSPDDAGAAMVGALVMILVNALILTTIVRLSTWRGWALVAGLTFSFYGVHTFVGQIEAYAFLTDLGELIGSGATPVLTMPLDFIGAMFLVGLALAVAGVPLTVLLFGRHKPQSVRSGATQSRRYLRRFSAGQWAWKLAAIIVVYELLYFGFGYYVAWSSEAVRAFYQGAHPGSFPAALWQNLVNTPLVYPWQALRALLWVAFTLPVIMMLRRHGWKGALTLAFFVALPMNLGHLVPNPFMPDAVRLAHFVETTSSNFLFGLILFWLLHRSHPSPRALFTRHRDTTQPTPKAHSASEST